MKPGILVSSLDLRPSLLSVLEGLERAALLQKVITSFAIDSDKLSGKFVTHLIKILPTELQRGFDRRIPPSHLRGKLHLLPTWEIFRLLVKQLGSEVLSHYFWLWAETRFDQRVAQKYAAEYECIYGMEHSSLETFRRQKLKGGLCILRQVMAHARVVERTLKREIEKFPQYLTPYSQIFLKDVERSIARKKEEYELADLIIANSEFVKSSFIENGVDPKKVVAVPTGCPACCGKIANAGRGTNPLIFLFVGTLSLRKGVHYLLEAWERLDPKKSAILWLAGHVENKKLIKDINSINIGIRIYGSLSQEKLRRLYLQADVFVLPTLLEGLSHSLLEALAFGLPIVTTKESGCGNFVNNRVNGLMVHSADVQSLHGALNWCLNHRCQLADMGRNSREKAGSWTVTESNTAHRKVIEDFLFNKHKNNKKNWEEVQ